MRTGRLVEVEFLETGMFTIRPDMLPTALPQLIFRARNARDLSIRNLASLVDYSHAALSMVERRLRQPSRALVLKIQEALDIRGVRIERGADQFEVVSLVDLLDREALAIDVPVEQREFVSFIFTTLQRQGCEPSAREATPDEKTEGIVAVLECSDETAGDLKISIQKR